MKTVKTAEGHRLLPYNRITRLPEDVRDINKCASFSEHLHRHRNKWLSELRMGRKIGHREGQI